MPPAPANDQTVTIGFLLMPLFSMMACVSAVEPLRVANRMAERVAAATPLLTDS